MKQGSASSKQILQCNSVYSKMQIFSRKFRNNLNIVFKKKQYCPCYKNYSMTKYFFIFLLLARLTLTYILCNLCLFVLLLHSRNIYTQEKAKVL